MGLFGFEESSAVDGSTADGQKSLTFFLASPLPPLCLSLLSVCMISHNQPKELSREECATVFEKKAGDKRVVVVGTVLDLVSYSMRAGSALI